MICPIMKDPIFLAQKSAAATAEDLAVAQDLLDTLEAHKDGCVGMAANMIGVSKRIIAFDNEGSYMVMFNPMIVKSAEPYSTEEGCLSLPGVRTTRRYAPSRCSIRMRNSKSVSRPLPAGRHKSSSTRSTTAMAF